MHTLFLSCTQNVLWKEWEIYTEILHISLCQQLILSLLFLGLSLLVPSIHCWGSCVTQATPCVQMSACLDVFPNIFNLEWLYNSFPYSPSSADEPLFMHFFIPVLVFLKLHPCSEGSYSFQINFWIISNPYLLLKAECLENVMYKHVLRQLV